MAGFFFPPAPITVRSMARINAKTRRIAGIALVLVAALVVQWYERSRPVATGDDGAARIIQAFQQEQSGVWVETAGRVQRVLSDDNEGSRHQRFIVALSGGHTVLVAHNIDLAERVPLASGDEVRLRGEYEWNPQGGVLHWTHHDPRRRIDGGWIRHEGRTFR